MERRKALVLAGTAISTSIAGCAGNGNIGGPSGPGEVAEAYVTAIFEGDHEEAQSYTIGFAAEGTTQEYVSEQAALDPELEDLFGVEEDGSTASVQFTYGVETGLGTHSDTGTVLLVEDDDWKVSRMYETVDGLHPRNAVLYTDVVDDGPVNIAADYILSRGSDTNTSQFVADEFEHPNTAVEYVDQSISLEEDRLDDPTPVSGVADTRFAESVSVLSISEEESSIGVLMVVEGGLESRINIILEQIDGEWRVVTYEDGESQ